MPTITEALTQAAQDLRDAVTAVLGLRSDIQTIRDQASTNVTTIIQNFNTRPAYQSVFVDQDNGSETNDGKTVNTPRKLIDAVLDEVGSTPTAIFLLSDATWRRKANIYANLIINGVAKSGAAPFYTPFTRQVTILGLAENSPSPGVGTFCAGAFLYASTVQFQNITFALQDTGALNYRYAFAAMVQTSFVVYQCNLNVSGASAGTLFGTQLGRVTASINALALGTGAAGHLFDGVAAGADPNAAWRYSTNLTSA